MTQVEVAVPKVFNWPKIAGFKAKYCSMPFIGNGQYKCIYTCINKLFKKKKILLRHFYHSFVCLVSFD
jgi:hypothetical protein